MTSVAATDTQIDLPEIRFDAGLPGFPEARRFALVQWGEEGPFSVLRCLDEPELQFVVVPPVMFFPDYEPELDDNTAERIGLRTAEDALILVMVTVGDDVSKATANLLGPIVINRHTNEAVQAVLASSGYEARTPLVGSTG